ncbi:glutamine amidotransferase [Lachnospiraceae bacterium PF1-22]|uniref:imidazole glycerol phosphate synthase subunit HisH n=1 Tax=Ohessyouella blattaphilus TaxID=2949333 RepID=UPI003E1AEF66
MIAIIDYDAGNMRSVEKALLYLEAEVKVTRDREELLAADKVVLPGVGNFGDAMSKLKEYNLIPTIKEVAASGKPFLGICLGLQLLFESSEESPGVEGLSLLPGKIVKFPVTPGYKIPHMGWNSLNFKNAGRLFAGLGENSFVYFVHSYYLQAAEKEMVKATSDYILEFDASIERGNVFGCQFHPEKSGDVGLQILQNFVALEEGK